MKAAVVGGCFAIAAAIIGALFTHWFGLTSPQATQSPSSPSSSSSATGTPSPARTQPSSSPPISPAQASSALLAAQQIAVLADTTALNNLFSTNEIPMLDLSVASPQVLGSCQTPQSSLPAPAANSPVKTGYFNGGNITGGADIGEQVAAYVPGGGAKALAAVKAVLQGCGFTQAPGTSANVIRFTGTVTSPCEYEVANKGDVLISVGISLSGQDALLDKLVSAITANTHRRQQA
jgi:hypothetical protein